MELTISFSGGRSSAVMTKLLMDRPENASASIVFCNTGCEHEATLEFVRDCQEYFGWNVVWLEAVVTHGKRVGIRHKIVDFATASRNGEPFEEYVKKHGLPGPTHPQCTSRLKEEVMDSYRHRQLGLKRGEYQTAIGIRADEADRMSAKAKVRGFIYPLVTAGYNKAMVNAECESWPFDLAIPGDHYGNCVWCWKKSMRKLMTLAIEAPESFDFPAHLERTYATRGAKDGSERRMFRGNKTTADIFAEAARGFRPYSEVLPLFDGILDVGGGCGDSCEIGADSYDEKEVDDES